MNSDRVRDDAQLFGALLDAAVDAVVVIDEQGTMRQVNQSCQDLFGYPTRDLIGKNVKLLMPPPYSQEHDGYLKNYRETGKKKIIGIGREVEGLSKDGRVFPMDLSVGEGQINGERFFIGIIRDLSERYALLHQLRERESEVRGLVENALVATGAIDPAGRFLSWNDAFEKVLGTSDLRGVVLSDLVKPRNKQRLDEAIAGLAEEGGSQLLTNQEFVTDPEHESVGDLFLSAIRDVVTPNTKIERVVVQFVDRTDQIAAERAAVEAQNHLAHLDRLGTLGEMAAGIAHEVNQPLGAIANYAQAARILLTSATSDPQRLSEILDKIASQAQRAGEVIRRMRSMADQHSSDQEVCSVGQVLEEVVHLFETDARFEISAIHLSIEPELPEISADRVQIQQVILNLLRNALDAMAGQPISGRSLMINCQQKDDKVEIGVTDTGHGIDAEVADLIMNPFFSTKDEGMGMGLAICHSIVAAHHGRLWHEPSSRGQGTTFFVQLPARKPSQNELDKQPLEGQP